ncbi:hypothetical protein Maes01_02521 [Microbulbifer aestuariivivens]|uniref:Uncharacterized protein n=1 Tax=Microbulbifer aestuariivivens TaxID=1908308 RepID=A0ABP9WTL3_9GAMM
MHRRWYAPDRYWRRALWIGVGHPIARCLTRVFCGLILATRAGIRSHGLGLSFTQSRAYCSLRHISPPTALLSPRYFPPHHFPPRNSLPDHSPPRRRLGRGHIVVTRHHTAVSKRAHCHNQEKPRRMIPPGLGLFLCEISPPSIGQRMLSQLKRRLGSALPGARLRPYPGRCRKVLAPAAG